MRLESHRGLPEAAARGADLAEEQRNRTSLGPGLGHAPGPGPGPRPGPKPGAGALARARARAQPYPASVLGVPRPSWSLGQLAQKPDLGKTHTKRLQTPKTCRQGSDFDNNLCADPAVSSEETPGGRRNFLKLPKGFRNGNSSQAQHGFLTSIPPSPKVDRTKDRSGMT